MPAVPPPEYRLFVALLIPDDIKGRMQAAQGDLRRAVPHAQVGWTRREQFHLTLKFLGGVGADRVEALARVLGVAAAGFEPLRLSAAGVGFFPNPRSPRVVWAGLRDAGDQLASLQRALEEACAPFTVEPVQGNFTGHVTLGRIKSARRIEVECLVRAAGAMAGTAFGEWTADRLELMRSELLPAGAHHTSLAGISLPR